MTTRRSTSDWPISRLNLARLLLVATLASLAACDTSTADPPEVLATGTAAGTVINDIDGVRGPSNGDLPLEGVIVRAAYRGTTIPVAIDTTEMNGQYAMEVPVGAYWITVDSVILGDSLEVVEADTISVAVLPGLTSTRTVALGVRRETIESARNLAPGQVVSVFGFALNDRDAFGDSTLHIREGNWSIRATTVFRAPISEGDSVRIAGTMAMDRGQPVIDRVTATRLLVTGLPDPPLISTGVASSAEGGLLDASHARIRNVVVIDTTRVNGEYQATVDDGSGPLVVEIDSDFFFNLFIFRPGTQITQLTGVLVPTGTGSWVLKPRRQADVF